MITRPIDSCCASTAVALPLERKPSASLGGFKPQFMMAGNPSAQPQSDIFQLLNKQWTVFSDYLIDLWSLLDSGLSLAQHYALAIPSAVRTSVAALGMLNLFMVPKMTGHVFASAWNLVATFPSRGLTSVVEGMARFPFLVGLTSAYAGIGALGVQQLLEKYGFSINFIKSIPDSIFPWVGYALRLSAIPQLMDISSGMEASAKLSGLLKPVEWLDMFKPVGAELFSVLNDYNRLLGKIAPADFDERIAKIHRCAHSWFVPAIFQGLHEVQSLTKDLRDRSVTHMHNQLLGFAANGCAIMAMTTAAYLVATSIFAILRSIFFLIQTYHRQTSM